MRVPLACGRPRVRQHSFVEIGHEIISTAFLFLPLIQEGELSIIQLTSERMVNRLGSLSRNSLFMLTDRLNITIAVDWDVNAQIKQ